MKPCDQLYILAISGVVRVEGHIGAGLLGREVRHELLHGAEALVRLRAPVVETPQTGHVH